MLDNNSRKVPRDGISSLKAHETDKNMVDHEVNDTSLSISQEIDSLKRSLKKE